MDRKQLNCSDTIQHLHPHQIIPTYNNPKSFTNNQQQQQQQKYRHKDSMLSRKVDGRHFNRNLSSRRPMKKEDDSNLSRSLKKKRPFKLNELHPDEQLALEYYAKTHNSVFASQRSRPKARLAILLSSVTKGNSVKRLMMSMEKECEELKNCTNDDEDDEDDASLHKLPSTTISTTASTIVDKSSTIAPFHRRRVYQTSPTDHHSSVTEKRSFIYRPNRFGLYSKSFRNPQRVRQTTSHFEIPSPPILNEKPVRRTISAVLTLKRNSVSRKRRMTEHHHDRRVKMLSNSAASTQSARLASFDSTELSASSFDIFSPMAQLYNSGKLCDINDLTMKNYHSLKTYSTRTPSTLIVTSASGMQFGGDDESFRTVNGKLSGDSKDSTNFIADSFWENDNEKFLKNLKDWENSVSSNIFKSNRKEHQVQMIPYHSNESSDTSIKNKFGENNSITSTIATTTVTSDGERMGKKTKKIVSTIASVLMTSQVTSSIIQTSSSIPSSLVQTSLRVEKVDNKEMNILPSASHSPTTLVNLNVHQLISSTQVSSSSSSSNTLSRNIFKNSTNPQTKRNYENYTQSFPSKNHSRKTFTITSSAHTSHHPRHHHFHQMTTITTTTTTTTTTISSNVFKPIPLLSKQTTTGSFSDNNELMYQKKNRYQTNSQDNYPQHRLQQRRRTLQRLQILSRHRRRLRNQLFCMFNSTSNDNDCVDSFYDDDSVLNDSFLSLTVNRVNNTIITNAKKKRSMTHRYANLFNQFIGRNVQQNTPLPFIMNNNNTNGLRMKRNEKTMEKNHENLSNNHKNGEKHRKFSPYNFRHAHNNDGDDDDDDDDDVDDDDDIDDDEMTRMSLQKTSRPTHQEHKKESLFMKKEISVDYIQPKTNIDQNSSNIHRLLNGSYSTNNEKRSNDSFNHRNSILPNQNVYRHKSRMECRLSYLPVMIIVLVTFLGITFYVLKDSRQYLDEHYRHLRKYKKALSLKLRESECLHNELSRFQLIRTTTAKIPSDNSISSSICKIVLVDDFQSVKNIRMTSQRTVKMIVHIDQLFEFDKKRTKLKLTSFMTNILHRTKLTDIRLQLLLFNYELLKFPQKTIQYLETLKKWFKRSIELRIMKQSYRPYGKVSLYFLTIFDIKSFYFGSMTPDDKYQIALHVSNCYCLTEDILKIFDDLWSKSQTDEKALALKEDRNFTLQTVVTSMLTNPVYKQLMSYEMRRHSNFHSTITDELIGNPMNILQRKLLGNMRRMSGQNNDDNNNNENNKKKKTNHLIYGKLNKKNSVSLMKTIKFVTLANYSHPFLQMYNRNIQQKIFIATNPYDRYTLRTRELTSVKNVIDSAKSYLYILINSYSIWRYDYHDNNTPHSSYDNPFEKTLYWPLIHEQIIKAAVERKVIIRIIYISSKNSRSENDIVQLSLLLYLTSGTDLKIKIDKDSCAYVSHCFVNNYLVTEDSAIFGMPSFTHEAIEMNPQISIILRNAMSNDVEANSPSSLIYSLKLRHINYWNKLTTHIHSNLTL
ncbi:hypothetical protein SNEBB_007181 [Seison nebaliae]|nr:hypothetical protein SNEBB_007181 [Seison nebaliae]